MEPITREEYYLAKIAGTYEGNTPEPVTIEEYYLATMAGDYSGNTPQPVTRLQYYMAKVAGVWGGSVPAPVTREEYYWAAIASGEGKVFPPVTREEHFLVLVADAYSVVLTVVTGNPALLENSKGNRGLESLTLYGKSTQVSTTGAQLISLNDSYGVTTVNGVTKTPIGISAWKLEGISKEDAIIYPYSSLTFLSLSKGDYVFSVFGTSKAKARYTIIGRGSSGYIQTGYSQKISIQEDVKLTFNFLIENGVESNGILMIMLNSGSTSLPWEPYTGGKPSPSPSYPQEIESAGQNGEIEVEVLSGNLFDKSAAYDLTQSGGWSASFDGEELKVVGNNITIGSIRLFNYKKTLPAGTYTFSISKPLPFEIRIDNYFLIKKGDTSATVTFDNGVSMSHFAVDAEPGATFNEQRFKIMLNAGSTALPYELYKPAQTLIIPTPNGLPGVPTIDNGNYTDASGQQWLCDEVDLKRGVYVQNVAFAEFGKGITSLTKNSGVSSKNIVSAYFFSIPRKRAKTRHTIMSNCLRFVANVSSGNPAYVISNESQTEAMYVSIPAELYENDDQMLNLLAEKKVKILYATYPTERPLSTEELEKYRSLRTYSPTTTVINDAGAGMSVGYAKMK